MTNVEKVKLLRDETMCPMNKINEALKKVDGDFDKAKALLVSEMSKVDVADMEKRVATATIVYGYVHNNRIGAMITIACQTDFVARNGLFMGLAKDICMHIVSTPIPPEYVSESEIPGTVKSIMESNFRKEITNKPEAVIAKIVEGKMKKQLAEMCLLNQSFVKDDSMTIEQLIASVSAQTREKIEVKKFVRMVAS